MASYSYLITCHTFLTFLDYVSQSPASLEQTSNAIFSLLNSKLELLTGGEDVILQKMVGNDIWIVVKKCWVGGNDNSRP